MSDSATWSDRHDRYHDDVDVPAEQNRRAILLKEKSRHLAPHQERTPGYVSDLDDVSQQRMTQCTRDYAASTQCDLRWPLRLQWGQQHDTSYGCRGHLTNSEVVHAHKNVHSDSRQSRRIYVLGRQDSGYDSIPCGLIDEHSRSYSNWSD